MIALNVAEKPSVAKALAHTLSGGPGRFQQVRAPDFAAPAHDRFRAFQSRGESQYNPIFRFNGECNNQRCEMVVTSVTGHLMELDFKPPFDTFGLKKSKISHFQPATT